MFLKHLVPIIRSSLQKYRVNSHRSGASEELFPMLSSVTILRCVWIVEGELRLTPRGKAVQLMLSLST